MRVASFKSFALATSLAIPMAAMAQYGQGTQSYNPQDQQNYGAQQSYDQQSYPDSGQEAVNQAPPPLPEYDQPPAPADGYIWTPGYWAFGPGGYYWVPGAWVLPPYEDALWTPGYWGYAPIGYFWNPGYWGLEVGFYGGINYGFGYFGTGFYGGCWRDHQFWYNREYSHINAYGRNTYSERYNGIRDVRPHGGSFTTVSATRGNNFRGGSYNGSGRGFANSPINTSPRGNGTMGQLASGHPVQAGSTFSGVNRGTYNAPMQRPVQTVEPSRSQGFSGYSQRMAPTQAYNGGGYSQRMAPAPTYNSGYSQRSAPAPSYSGGGGGSFHGYSGGGGGGGSFHGGGGGGFSGGGGGGSHGGGGGGGHR